MPPLETEVTEVLNDLKRRRRREEARQHARGPKPIRNIVAEVMLRRGYGRVRASEDLGEIWRDIVGEQFAAHCQPGRLRRGVLEVMVTHSVFVQELTSSKKTILVKLSQEAPQMKIRDLRFRTGRL